jgi:HlyD family secretion protein
MRRRAHPPRWLFAGLLLLLAGAAVTWYGIRTNWVPPWVQPPAPLSASGTLEADEVLVGSQVAGRIVELAREGQSVQANDVVARLDDSLIQVQIRQGDVAARQRLEVQADQYILRSPIAGVITRVPLHTGEVASPGQAVATVADLSVLKLTAYVLENDLGQVQVGQEVSITADPFPGRTFRGVVTSTNPRAEFTPRNVQTKADRLNLVFGVRILVDNPDGALKPGMPVDVAFTTPS